MFELVKLTERTYYFDVPTKIGVYLLQDNKVILIDSGLNEKGAKRVVDTLRKMNLTVSAVINTHSHTDHAGGDRYICSQMNCKVYVPGVERYFVENPDLEAGFVYGGFPCDDFRKKFMNTPPCPAFDIKDLELPKGMEIIPLPGHTSAMIGVKTPDDVYFIADSVNGEHALNKAKITYIYDVDTQLKTLEFIGSLDKKLCVPAHTQPTTNSLHLAQININNIKEVQRDILELLKTPKTVEQLVAGLYDKYGLSDDFMGIVMITSAVKSHLSYLRKKEEINWFMENHFHYWQKAEE